MLLSACSAKRPAQPPLTFRTALLQSGGCSFSAAITADYGESDASFTLDCVFSPETGASVTVTEPGVDRGHSGAGQGYCSVRFL